MRKISNPALVVIPSKCALYLQPRSSRYYCRIKLDTGGWYRIATHEIELENAKERALELYYEARIKTKDLWLFDRLQGLGIEVDQSLPSARVIRALEQIIEWRGKPAAIRCDNGPEYISQGLVGWANENQITLMYIQPGKPTQNAYIE